MNDEDIRAIESDLSLELPDALRTTLIDYPFPEPLEDLYSSRNELVAANQRLRKEGFFGTTWPNHFLVVGQDGCGNFWFLDLSKQDSPLCLADHENEFDAEDSLSLEFMPSLEDFISYLKEEEANFQKE